MRRLALFVCAVVLYGCTSTGPLAPSEPPRAFAPEEVAKGAELAHLGNCMGCHTAEGGRPYAGGAAVPTPFGTVYGTNITPDRETGIGLWSLAAFERAMREGVDRGGRELYPAFPYDHFTKLTDEDVAALYAFVMTREPVKRNNRADRIPIPRPLVALWKALYFRPGRFVPKATESAQWNRGAYLVQGLGHCGACHTPRNALGAEETRNALAGGEVDGWDAPALDSDSPSPIPWSADALETYLERGIAPLHAQAAGPMKEVVQDLSQVSAAERRALATYVRALDTRSAAERRRAAEMAMARSQEALSRRNPVYDGACAQCHDRTRAQDGGALRLPLATALALKSARNLTHIVREGIVPQDGERGRWMPAFAGALTDGQMNELVAYLRSLVR